MDSESRSRSPNNTDGLSIIRVDSSEAGLVLGRGGATKRKIENAADVDIELVTTEEGDSNIELRGPETNRDLGRDYICFLLLNRKGEPLDIDFNERDDCSWIDVPQDTIGYITGRERSTLNSMEEETDTLMFFMDKGRVTDDESSKHDVEKLVIFGPARGRRIAHLKLMSAIETKASGFFLDHKDRWNLDNTQDGKLGITHVKMTEGQFKYALGRRGTTRRKLERASGAIIEYIGYIAFISGTKEERRRGRDYINYLLDQREGETHIDNINDRGDVSIIKCPEEYIGYITGHRGSELRSIEERTGTFCFMYDEGGDDDRGWWRRSGRQEQEQQESRGHHHSSLRLLIFSFDPLRRDDAEEMVRDRIESRIRDDINKGIPVPIGFDNKHSNEEIENKRKDKWGDRPAEGKLPQEDEDTKKASSPRSVTPVNNREDSRKRSRSEDDDDEEEERSKTTTTAHGGPSSRERRRHHTPPSPHDDRSGSRSSIDSESSDLGINDKSHSKTRSLSKESIEEDGEKERDHHHHHRYSRSNRRSRSQHSSSGRRSSRRRRSRSRSDSYRSRSTYSSRSPSRRHHHHHHHYRSDESSRDQ